MGTPRSWPNHPPQVGCQTVDRVLVPDPTGGRVLAYLLLGIAALQDANQYRVTGGGNELLSLFPSRVRYLPAANRGVLPSGNQGAPVHMQRLNQNAGRMHPPLLRFTFLPTSFVGFKRSS